MTVFSFLVGAAVGAFGTVLGIVCAYSVHSGRLVGRH